MYKFHCEFKPEDLRTWTAGQLKCVRIRKRQNGRLGEWVDRYVPVPYDRIVSQLIHESLHGDKDVSHEARRRQEYAQRVLNVFGDEIFPFNGPWKSFRPKSLTPLLQRQLWGVEDFYAPAVQDAVATSSALPTILDATEFYLADDPADPIFCATYLRNMIYITLARWHLAILVGKIELGDAAAYETFRDHTELLVDGMLSSEDEEDDGDDPMKVPMLTELDVVVIIQEHLGEFFTEELERDVSETSTLSMYTANHPPQSEVSIPVLDTMVADQEERQEGTTTALVELRDRAKGAREKARLAQPQPGPSTKSSTSTTGSQRDSTEHSSTDSRMGSERHGDFEEGEGSGKSAEFDDGPLSEEGGESEDDGDADGELDDDEKLDEDGEPDADGEPEVDGELDAHGEPNESPNEMGGSLTEPQTDPQTDPQPASLGDGQFQVSSDEIAEPLVDQQAKSHTDAHVEPEQPPQSNTPTNAMPDPQIEPQTDAEKDKEAEPPSEGITDVAMGDKPEIA